MFLVFLIGILAGFIDSTIGSGGLISIPLLIFLGLSPQTAIATDRLGSIGQTIGALFSFIRSKKIVWKYIVPYSVLALIGSFIGTNILLKIDTQNMQKIIGILLLLVLPLILFNKKVGVDKVSKSKTQIVIGYCLYLLVMVYNGFFGTGAGPIATYIAVALFGITLIESTATNVIPWFLLSVSSVIIFAKNNVIDYRSGLALFVGMVIGGYVGANLIVKIGNLWLKRLFIAIVIISSVRLIFC